MQEVSRGDLTKDIEYRNYMAQLKETYEKKVIPSMMEKFGYKNRMVVPKIEKVVVNTGFGKLVATKTGEDLRKTIESIIEDTSTIAGQHATTTKARQSIAGFKLREGTPVGAKVTLRGKRMYDFLERLIRIVLPRSRDFQGINPASVDANGNLSIGMKEHVFFPEISLEKVRNIFGLEITVTTTAKTREEGLELLRLSGFPIKKETETE